MWKALGDIPTFSLTHGKPLNEAIGTVLRGSERHPGGFLVSGDYSSATDKIHMDVSQALLDGILESISHEPTKLWARWEVGPHIIQYPKETGLDDVTQSNGQLMGSLLSFPLLCLANWATVKDLSPDCLINGDDILFWSKDMKDFQTWKSNATSLGLEFSIGKNYISPSWGSINSQLIATKQGVVPFSKTKSLITGPGGHLTEEISRNFRGLFVRMNKEWLAKDCRSIDVPASHGGLGCVWNKKYSFRIQDYQSYFFFLHEGRSLTFTSQGKKWKRLSFRDEGVRADFLRRNSIPVRLADRWNEHREVTSIDDTPSETISTSQQIRTWSRRNLLRFPLTAVPPLHKFPPLGLSVSQTVPNEGIWADLCPLRLDFLPQTDTYNLLRIQK
jgi:hypothetical protein